MVVKCEIKFDQNPFGVYFSGQSLSGSAEVRLTKPKKVKGVSLRISGKAMCNWTERHAHGSGKNRRTHTVTFSGREDYIRTITYLVGSEVGNEIEIPAGLHTYNFACALPELLPTSFEGDHGYIRYTVRLVLERSLKTDQSYKVGFTVLKQCDLNYESPVLRIPTQMEVTQNFCCGPCRSEPLLLVATIAQSGFVSGQAINIQATIKNMSNTAVKEMKFKLEKTISYYSQTPRYSKKVQTVIIQEQRSDRIVAKRDSGQFFITVLVPPSPTTNVNSSQIIHITYAIRVEAKVNQMHSNPYVVLPITIGTVPLQNIPTNSNFPINDTKIGFVPPIVVQPTALVPSAPTPNGLFAMPVQTYPNNNFGFVPEISGNYAVAGPSTLNRQLPIIDPISEGKSASRLASLPPPSYEESTQEKRKIEDDEDQEPLGEQLYAPRYPVYRFENEPVAVANDADTLDATEPIDHRLRSEKLMEKVKSWE